jgi:hypothetical protein
MPARDNPLIIAPPDSVPASAGLLYDDWVVAEAEATLALAAWGSAARGRKAFAYAAYVAALDTEEAAAAELEQRLAGRR